MVAAGLAGVGVSPALADSVTIVANKDNTLYQNSAGQTSNGRGEWLFVGVTATNEIRRGLLGFDVAAAGIPSGAIITSVRVQLRVDRTVVGGQPIELHRVTRSWGEGSSNAGSPGGLGAPAQANDATWLHSFYDATLWTTPGGDFLSTVSSVVSVSGTGLYAWQGNGLIGDVQSWLDNPGSNHGWLLKHANEGEQQTAKRFISKDHATNNDRPKLTIEYIIPAPGTAMMAAVGLAAMARRRR